MAEAVTVNGDEYFTLIVCVEVHPADEVPVTVYVVVTRGDAVIVVPVVVLNPAAGAQE